VGRNAANDEVRMLEAIEEIVGVKIREPNRRQPLLRECGPWRAGEYRLRLK
jgi:hypothetical protein